MWYVMSDAGVEMEFDTFEEADNYVDANGSSMLWVESEEDADDYYDDYDECGYDPYMGCYSFDC